MLCRFNDSTYASVPVVSDNDENDDIQWNCGAGHEHVPISCVFHQFTQVVLENRLLNGCSCCALVYAFALRFVGACDSRISTVHIIMIIW